MDLGTIIGLILGPAAIILGMIGGGSGLSYYIHVPSMFITIGGSVAGILISHPLSRVLGIIRYLNHILRVPNYEEERIIGDVFLIPDQTSCEKILQSLGYV